MTERAPSGVVGNERLTALTGAVVLVLSVAEIATVPTLGSLIVAHFFIGVLLAGPVVAKTASTGWRFIRYYTRDPAYRRKGPPRLLLRLTAPLLVVSTLVLIGSGIALAITGPAPEILIRVHVVSFLFWLATLAVHVFAYVRRVPGLIADDWRRRTIQQKRGKPEPRGRRMRLAVNIAVLVLAAISAVLLLPTAAPWEGWRGQAVTGPGVLAVAVCIGTAVAVMVKRRKD
ncbi:hypothetical protein [Arthrobacter bambusae]|uniref:DUF4405 domain-containing protein n=1 Tax=Arthrobacter bambusae TaxID=1338426 RepID=A0AAW8DCU2_9MICC|nr:hypothetical protein [Arthrobacter bambusae]MDP9903672.1 hypothetical protein [Arthrobacter bambusae]MDQ0128333.1 hypothetical protein [Arthrobacter bambusae]MDQ0179675.1 hypothetical protein [Arthrobacter bambusae]